MLAIVFSRLSQQRPDFSGLGAYRGDVSLRSFSEGRISSKRKQVVNGWRNFKTWDRPRDFPILCKYNYIAWSGQGPKGGSSRQSSNGTILAFNNNYTLLLNSRIGSLFLYHDFHKTKREKRHKIKSLILAFKNWNRFLRPTHEALLGGTQMKKMARSFFNL